MRRTPPPDAVRPQHSIHPAVPSASPPVILRFQPERHPAAPALLPRPNAHDAQPTFLKTSSPSSPPPPPSTRAPDFIVVGLFALRLTKRLIEGLEPYLYRDADISWLSTFLAQYPIEYALAKISGSRKDEYMSTYQEIVSRMKKQHRYPMRFMQLNPDRSVGQASSDGGRVNEREMTDRESLFFLCCVPANVRCSGAPGHHRLLRCGG